VKKTKRVNLKKTPYKIIDVPFSKQKNLGTKASENTINYHYQHLINLVVFLNKIYMKKKINNISFFKNHNDSVLQMDIKNKTIFPYYITLRDFEKKLKNLFRSGNRFIPITLNSELPIGTVEIENHTNIILIDTELKNIEFFEPHGYKPKESTISESVSKYHNKLKILTLFFKELLPKYNLLNVVDYIKDRSSFQSKYDSHSGYCVTWSTLYTHYRLLNQNVPIKNLMKYLHNLIDTSLLLRYARHIEETLKNKV